MQKKKGADDRTNEKKVEKPKVTKKILYFA